MNKTNIKNFAIWARNKLIADIQYRAGLMGIMAEGIKNALPQSTPMLEFHLRIITIPDSIMQKIGKMQLRFPMSRMLMVLSPSPTKSIWKTILSPVCVTG